MICGRGLKVVVNHQRRFEIRIRNYELRIGREEARGYAPRLRDGAPVGLVELRIGRQLGKLLIAQLHPETSGWARNVPLKRPFVIAFRNELPLVGSELFNERIGTLKPAGFLQKCPYKPCE